MSDRESEMLDKLILEGAIEVVGIDSKTGEFLYAMTNKMQEVSPELYKEHLNSVHKDIMSLWENRYLYIDFMDENPIVTLTPKSFDKEAIKMLSPEDFMALEEVKRVLNSKL
jgi:hypothetical protein